MKNEIQQLRSRINALNAQAAQIHDSFHFSPQERAELTAPLLVQVQSLNDELNELVHAAGTEVHAEDAASFAAAAAMTVNRKPQTETRCATPLKQTANAIH